jgi:hypothetical protein
MEQSFRVVGLPLGLRQIRKATGSDSFVCFPALPEYILRTLMGIFVSNSLPKTSVWNMFESGITVSEVPKTTEQRASRTFGARKNVLQAFHCWKYPYMAF